MPERKVTFGGAVRLIQVEYYVCRHSAGAMMVGAIRPLERHFVVGSHSLNSLGNNINEANPVPSSDRYQGTGFVKVLSAGAARCYVPSAGENIPDLACFQFL